MVCVLVVNDHIEDAAVPDTFLAMIFQ